MPSKKLFELSSIPYQFLDLTPGAGNLLGVFYWEILSPWRGESLTLNTGASPRDAAASTLWQILEDKPHPRYYLTRKACRGILRRSSERDKPLPTALRNALELQAGMREDVSLNRRSCCLFDFLLNVVKEIVIEKLPQGDTQPIAELL